MNLKFEYKNWQGKVAIREVQPISLWFGFTEFHKETQWFLKAYDVNKQAGRDFALKDIIKFM